MKKALGFRVTGTPKLFRLHDRIKVVQDKWECGAHAGRKIRVIADTDISFGGGESRLVLDDQM